MRKHHKIKCGGYTLKDGVLLRHPTRFFRMPDNMPDRMRTPYPKTPSQSFLMREYERCCDSIDELNALRENAWKRSFERKYMQLSRIDNLGDWIAVLPAFIKPIVRKKRSSLLAKFMAENCREC